MTSEQIKRDMRNKEIYGSNYIGFQVISFWLKEIAYQFAVSNELKTRFDHINPATEQNNGDPR